MKHSPSLYSCIFGEGVFNDIIVLFSIVSTLQNSAFTPSIIFLILGQFFALAFISIGTGIFFGFATALMFKYMRFLTISAVTETFIMLVMGFFAYYLAEITVVFGLDMSGIISMLTYAII